jgi:hypothetical protein
MKLQQKEERTQRQEEVQQTEETRRKEMGVWAPRGGYRQTMEEALSSRKSDQSSESSDQGRKSSGKFRFHPPQDTSSSKNSKSLTSLVVDSTDLVKTSALQTSCTWTRWKNTSGLRDDEVTSMCSFEVGIDRRKKENRF